MPEGGVGFQAPAPLRSLLEQQPSGFSHSPCQVCHRGVARDDKVAIGNDRSRFKEVPGLMVGVVLVT